MGGTLARLDNGKFQRIARIFSKNWGVRVVLEGMQPCTYGQTVVIPVNSDELSEATQQVLEGVLDHEVSHVREDQEALERQKVGEKCLTPSEQFEACKDKTEHLILNCFEDVRIENNARGRWPGMADNLAAMARHYVGVMRRDCEREKPVNSWSLVGSIIAWGARGDFLGWVPPWAQDLVETLRPEMEAANGARSVEDCYRLTLDVIEKMKDLVAEEEKKREGEEKRRKKGEQQAGKGEGGAEGGRGGEAGDTVAQASGTKADGDGASEEGDPGEPGPGREPSDGSDPGESGGGGELGDGDDPGGARSRLLEGLEQEAEVEDLADSVRALVEDKARKDGRGNRHRRWMPHPEALRRDRWRKPPHGSGDAYRAILKRVRPQISVMRSRLRVHLQTLAEDRIEADRESGAVDAASLYSLPQGNRRIFSERLPGIATDTVVSMLVDQSGSMDTNDKYKRAREAAVALAETMEALEIPFEIVGFDNYHGGSVTFEQPYTRHLPFRFDVYKAFAEKHRAVRTRLCRIRSREENVDGEAVLVVARRLAVQPQSRKILVVLSDGLPRGGENWDTVATVEWHLGEAIRAVSRAGIEIYGVGICSDCVESYYTRENGSAHVVVNCLDELAVQVVRLLSGRLMAGRRAA